MSGKILASRRGVLAVLATSTVAPLTMSAQGDLSDAPLGPSILPSDYGLTGRYAQDATQGMQRMFDEAPPGAIIDFADGMDEGGDYRISGTVIIRKPLSLRGRNSRIVGTMADERTDLIRFEPTGELRGIVVEGMRLAFNSGGRDALSFAGGDIGVIGNVVSRCDIAGGPGGYAVRLAGLGNHFNVVRDCSLTGTGERTGAVFLSSADGNKLQDNVIAGIGAGVRIDVINGAYKTGIIGGSIVSRDGGVELLAAQQVDIERVQFEQGRGNPDGDRNRSPHGSHIVIAGKGTPPGEDEVRDIRIVACNFGSGGNQEAAITLLRNARDILIEDNYFASIGTSGVDIRILDPSVFWTRIGPDNRVGGTRNGLTRGQANTTDPKALFATNDRGTGTYGVFKDASAMGLSAGWRALDGFAFWKHGDDILRFRSRLVAGDTREGAVVAQLPVGFRPVTRQIAMIPTSSNGIAEMALETDGRMVVRSVPDGATLFFDQINLPIVGRSQYVSGPY